MRGLAVLAFVCALGVPVVVACGVSSTSVSLLVTSDVPCAELNGVDISVATVGVRGERSLETNRCQDTKPEARIGTVRIVPGAGAATTISVRIVAGVERPAGDCARESRFEGCLVAERTLQFVPGRDIEDHVALRRASLVSGIPTPVTDAGAGGDAGDAGDAGDVGAPDVFVPLPDGGPACGVTEKVCDSKCVSVTDPSYGCMPAGCSPCPDLSIGDYVCAAQQCTLLRCKPGYKKCGAGCVPADETHGCLSPSCSPCDTVHGTASCKTDGSCGIACSPGYKVCGGKCVSVGDPTYGCSNSGCSAAGCPSPGGGTLACQGTTCVIGSCPAGTKNCNQKCVPTDVQNGCEQASRCTACATSETCSGSPTVCTCVPQPLNTTCSGKACGPATDNCGQTVTCPDRCHAPDTCGGGGVGKNKCGCTSDPACSGKNCGGYYDNCGRYQYCGDCAWPEFCGGGGGDVCGAPPDGDCGPNWGSMGSFTCDAQHAEHQTICGCHPPMYYDPAYWARQGSDCYEHFTGRGC